MAVRTIANISSHGVEAIRFSFIGTIRDPKEGIKDKKP
jgi:hypothetical protein